MQQDEVYLIDMWRLVRRQRWWFVGTFLVIVALAAAYLATAKRQWEAEAWIQIGQVAAAPAGQDPKVEPLLRVMERMKTDTFRDDVVSAIGIPPKDRAARLYAASMKLDPEPYANLIHLQLRAYSAEDARQLALATLARLKAIHDALGKLPLSAAHQRLDEVDAELAQAMADRARLREAVNAGRGDAAVASLSLASTDEGIRNLQQARSDISARLADNYTFETSMPWPIHVSDDPVAPMVPLVAGLGVLGGLFMGALVAVAIDARQRSTLAPASGTHWVVDRHGGERDEPTARTGDADAA
ncbi:hypothetical protein KPL74_14185 [Bacillus sp. NP157]|nr:hypothetical protein KPL74_14185 [Bacillus sp. NP157]